MYLISKEMKMLCKLLKSMSLKINIKRAIVNENFKKKTLFNIFSIESLV